MRILAMDTATNGCSAALSEGGHIVARRFEPMVRGQAEALMPMVKAVLDEAAIDVAALDLLAVTVGPGTFTGLRIGLAAARGLSVASGISCLGITTTEAIAGAVDKADYKADRGERRLLVAIDSKRDDVYVQMFGPDGQALGTPEAVEPENLTAFVGEEPFAVVGDAAGRVAELLGVDALDAPGLPDAACVAALAERQWQAMDETQRAALVPPEPLYLRPPDAKPAKDGGGLRPSMPPSTLPSAS